MKSTERLFCLILHLWTCGILTLSINIWVFKRVRWLLNIQILLAFLCIIKHVHQLFHFRYLFWIFLLVHIFLNHLWVIKRLTKYVIVCFRTILIRDKPRLKIIWRTKFLFKLILLHETIDIVLINRRRHFKLWFSWNNLMNTFFVIVCWLIWNHIETTFYTLTWITFTHFYFSKKLIAILLHIVRVWLITIFILDKK